MMDWYTDTSALIPGSAPVDEVPAPLRPAWNALVSGAPAFHGVDPDAGPGFTAGIVIGRAPRSQFAALQELLDQGTTIPDGLVAVAGEGTGFRGQRARSWIALPGNLHGCWYRHVDRSVSELGQGLAMLPTLAVVDALTSLVADCGPPGIKWVNDVMWRGKKVAGCLAATRVRERRVVDVLFGIGVNVAAAPAIAGGGAHLPAGCVHDITGRGDVAWPDVLRAMTGHIHHRLEQLLGGGLGALLDDYRDRSCVIGRRVRVWPQDEGAAPLGEGVVRDIAHDLALAVEGMPDPVRDARITLVD